MKKNADKLEKAKEIVKKLARKRLPEANIVDVEIAEDVGWDGDDMLRVDVVFNSEGDKLNVNGTSGFITCLREELSKIDIEAFPLMSWILEKELIAEQRAASKKKRVGHAA